MCWNGVARIIPLLLSAREAAAAAEEVDSLDSSVGTELTRPCVLERCGRIIPLFLSAREAAAAATEVDVLVYWNGVARIIPLFLSARKAAAAAAAAREVDSLGSA